MTADRNRRFQRADATDLDRMVSGQFSLEIACKGCGKRLVVDPLPLLRLAVLKRWPRNIIQLGKHLRCRCGRNHPALMAVDEAAVSPSIGIIDEGSFNALKKRLRR